MTMGKMLCLVMMFTWMVMMSSTFAFAKGKHGAGHGAGHGKGSAAGDTEENPFGFGQSEKHGGDNESAPPGWEQKGKHSDESEIDGDEDGKAEVTEATDETASENAGDTDEDGDRPHGWDQGKKTGWHGEDMPPGLAKKQNSKKNKDK